jgi:hypothetical protein
MWGKLSQAEKAQEEEHDDYGAYYPNDVVHNFILCESVSHSRGMPLWKISSSFGWRRWSPHTAQLRRRALEI